MNLLILTLSSIFFVFLLTIIVLYALTQNRIHVEKKIKDLVNEQDENIVIVKKTKKSKTKLPISKLLEREFSTIGLNMRPEEFLIIWILLVIIPSGIMLLIKINPIAVIAITSITVVMPIIYVRIRKAKQLLIFDNQLGDALMQIGNCLRSGLTFQQALASIANEMDDPIARELKKTVKEIQFGTSLDKALTNLMTRVHSMDLMLTVSAVQIQNKVGGNLTEILYNISETIRERQKLKNDIRVMTASGRISGLIIGLLPVGLGGVLMIISPGYVETFFETTLGTALIVISVVLEIIGFFAIKKVVTIKY